MIFWGRTGDVETELEAVDLEENIDLRDVDVVCLKGRVSEEELPPM